MRDVIGALPVKCPNSEDDGSKRRRGNDGEAVSEITCAWTGACEDLQSHDDICEFKVVTCNLGGCGYKCCRKDLDEHLSGGGFFRHMTLVEKSITERYDKRIKDLEQSLRNAESKARAAVLKAQANANKIVELERKLDTKDRQTQPEQPVHRVPGRNFLRKAVLGFIRNNQGEFFFPQ